MIILTDSFKKRELKDVAVYFTLADIKSAVIRIQSSGIEMKNAGFRDCKLFKVRIGSKPAGRMIVFVQVQHNYFIPIVIRLKKDKVFGENLSLQNKKAKELIIRNIYLALEDIQDEKYERIELS